MPSAESDRGREVPIIATRYRLRVNPVACDAFGYCAELVPELVSLDEWGYPIIRDEAVPPHLLELASLAVRECPRRALFLEEVARPASTARARVKRRV
jgi:ferredoxin